MRRFLRLFRRSAAENLLADEMREHFDEKVEELVSRGMPRAQAEAETRRRFGNATAIAEQSRDEWAYPRLENLLQDLRYGLRSLARNPLFAAVVIVPLALGIGANTAIFTVVEASLIRSLPYAAPDRLVHLFEVDNKNEPHPYEASYPDFLDWRTAQRNFEDVAGYSVGGTLTLGGGTQPEQIAAAMVTPNFFPLLGVAPAAGRSFIAAEGEAGATRVVVIGDSLWRGRFHADPKIVGSNILLNLRPTQVIGILPPGFHFAPAGQPELWLTVIASPQQRERRYWHWLNAIGRLRPSATLAQGQAELDAIAARIGRADPGRHPNASIIATPLREIVVGQVRPVLLVLLGAIGLVLLIACANVANLLLARSAAREKELAVRGSLGATRGRLIQQLLTESLVLAGAGGILGLGIARFGVDALIGAIPGPVSETLPFLRGLTMHGGMLAFTLAISLLTGVLFGLAPALRSSRAGWGEALKAGRGNSAGAQHQRLRRLLLVGEVAISIVLLAGAGLMMKSTLRLLEVNPGFATAHLLTARIGLPGVRYRTAADVATFYGRLLPAVESIPGVRGVATVSVLPLSGGGNTGTMQVEGRGTASPTLTVMVRTISRDYFRTLGIPLLSGRAFDDRDRPGATRVVVVNRTLARQSFPMENPIGKKVFFPWSGGSLEIVGVAGDENTVSLDAGIRPAVYFAARQDGDGGDLVIRTAGAPAVIISALRDQVRQLDPEVPIFAIRSMEEIVADSPSTFLRRYPALLIGIFAAIALIMAVIGTYGLVAYGVTQRRHEIGIRIALGAQRTDILRMVVGHGMVLVLLGVAIGLGGAAFATRALSKLLFGVQPLDAGTFATVSIVLVAAALIASFIPALRATKIVPGSD